MRFGRIYLICFQYQPFAKIGSSHFKDQAEQFESRVKNIAGNPVVVFMWDVNIENRFAIENAIHHKLRAKRVWENLEFFQLHDENGNSLINFYRQVCIY